MFDGGDGGRIGGMVDRRYPEALGGGHVVVRRHGSQDRLAEQLLDVAHIVSPLTRLATNTSFEPPRMRTRRATRRAVNADWTLGWTTMT